MDRLRGVQELVRGGKRREDTTEEETRCGHTDKETAGPKTTPEVWSVSS